MKNQGISLITLIITIIVIIILAAIVIWTGLKTPDSAQFSAFTNDVDTIYTAMIDAYANKRVEHAISGEYRTAEQIYAEIANKTLAIDQYAAMGTTTVTAGTTTVADGTDCQNIDPTNNTLGITLPKVRDSRDLWFVTSDGRIFNATGFPYNGRTYWNASYYTVEEKDTLASAAAAKTRAEKIAEAMVTEGASFAVTTD